MAEQITTAIELRPFLVPNYVAQIMPARPRQEGFQPAPTYKLSELSSEVLDRLCTQFRAEVFTKAGKPDPAKEVT